MQPTREFKNSLVQIRKGNFEWIINNKTFPVTLRPKYIISTMQSSNLEHNFWGIYASTKIAISKVILK